MSTTKKVRYGVSLFVVAVVAGLAGSALVLGAVTPKVHGSPGRDGDQVFDNVQDAEVSAGYEVYVPSFIPDGFQRGSILVVTHKNANNDKSVVQFWPNVNDNSFFIVQQTPGLDGLIEGGRSTNVRGRPAEMVRYPGSLDRPFELASFYWAEEGMGFVVSGSLVGPVTEEVVRKVAESMEAS